MQKYYYPNISQVLSDNVGQKVGKMINDGINSYMWNYVFLALGYVSALIFCFILTMSIRKTLRLENILMWVDFDVLRTNHKYIKYVKENKLTLR